MIHTTNHSRVQVPDRHAADHQIPPLMTSVTQSSHRDGDILMFSGAQLHNPDLQQSINVGTWNVLTLSSPGYLTAAVLEQGHYNIAAVGFTETRIQGSGESCVCDALVLCSEDQQSRNGVTLLLQQPLINALDTWNPVSDRLLTARLSHRHGHLSKIVAYRVVGPHRSGSPNDDTARLLSFSTALGLTTMGSWYKRLNIHRWTWLSNDGHTQKEINHILCRCSDRGIFTPY